MRLTIRHETRYRFDVDAYHSVQYLRLTPRNDPCQRVIEWNISTPGRLAEWSDGFENPCHVSVQDGPHEEIAVIVNGVVDLLMRTQMASFPTTTACHRAFSSGKRRLPGLPRPYGHSPSGFAIHSRPKAGWPECMH